jgi:hypothetical protein
VSLCRSLPGFAPDPCCDIAVCRYCYYHETQNILGNTYGMAVLQVRSHCRTAVSQVSCLIVWNLCQCLTWDVDMRPSIMWSLIP